jgi:hypothetical protein
MKVKHMPPAKRRKRGARTAHQNRQARNVICVI